MSSKNIHVIGAGLVGSLLSIFLSKKGHKVHILEKRSDMRKSKISAGKSINLALSDRGWKALELVGISDEIKKVAIPMYGRMIHDEAGNTNFLPYGKDNQAIYSVSRGGLNCVLMDLAEKHGATISFEKGCKHIDLKTGSITVAAPNGKEETHHSDLIFGSDGAYSAARLQLQLQTDRFNYSQHYLEHGYKELNIPAKADGEFTMEKNALHIWPRGQFMLIALPNMGGSFTCTLFFPFEGENSFKALDTPEKMMAFFKKTFADAVPLMPTLESDFFNNPTSSLVTVKCFPWSVEDNLCLIGDAAHAIVPFFGQGMNCGFEDCTVLNQIIEEKGDNWQDIFKAFQASRKPNSDAIAELAVMNFIEMRDLVAHPDFVLRKKIEAQFSKKHPEKWLPLYSMVTFSHEPYSKALNEGKRQDRIMQKVMSLSGIENKWDSKEVEEMMLDLLKE